MMVLVVSGILWWLENRDLPKASSYPLLESYGHALSLVVLHLIEGTWRVLIEAIYRWVA